MSWLADDWLVNLVWNFQVIFHELCSNKYMTLVLDLVQLGQYGWAVLPWASKPWQQCWQGWRPVLGRSHWVQMGSKLSRAQVCAQAATTSWGGVSRAWHWVPGDSRVIPSTQDLSSLTWGTTSHLGSHKGVLWKNQRGFGKDSGMVGLEHWPERRCLLLCGM